MKKFNLFLTIATTSIIIAPIVLTVSCDGDGRKIEATWETGGYVYEGSFNWNSSNKPTEYDIAREVEKNSHVKYVKILSWNWASK